ncbi:P-loop containing nucleoside triphosphate hydrolase protein [Laetiporus sulphureus 93-53]|uniref:p-loop containing nucleoside triphosphate hydrolase protein n=1 Tax=Laetiporus sulphureus 93-53 TaxID=1314785 RepID=A0A165H0I1_9APHY|nr:P-loop containing nucleoside triphosphate hydrolase protein [Laetiporus sulphureus 93-53]KZT11082.1 P-loop containing nucleoside triphosphate hydrolase protein [Laetiporus sulphureus 93-53]
MSSPRTRSTVLGKRAHQATTEPTTSIDVGCGSGNTVLPSPDPTPDPKRPRTSFTQFDDDGNKENVPPFVVEYINSPSVRMTRPFRRTNSETANSFRENTPPRRRSSASNTLSAPQTPVNPLSQHALATPPSSPPQILRPLHMRAQALLRSTCNDRTEFAGRQVERETMRDFIMSLISQTADSVSASTLYISGLPGTGKTALVNAVLESLATEVKQGGVQVFFINCMALHGVDAVWDRLAEILNIREKVVSVGRKSKKPKETPIELVERFFAEREQKCIIILDELDHITSTAQSLNSLFMLAHSNVSKVRLIGIANTHTLTSSSTASSSVKSLAGVETLHFAPYCPQDLVDIVNSRLSSLSNDDDIAERFKEFLPALAVTLLSRKIAAQTGDVRAMFEVLRGAIDLAATPTSPDSLMSHMPSVTPSCILTALKAYLSVSAQAKSASSSSSPSASQGTTKTLSDSETIIKVRELGLQQRLALLALLSARKRVEAGLALSSSHPAASPTKSARSPIKRTQSVPTISTAPSLDVMQLHSYYSSILTGDRSPLPPVSRSEFADLLGMLETAGLVTLSSGSVSLLGSPSKSRRRIGRTTSFNMTGAKGCQEVRLTEGVRVEEISRCLGIADSQSETSDVREEEIRAIWEQECARIAREVKANAPVCNDVFDDATHA